MPQADTSNIFKCPRCRAKKIYSIRRDNARCSNCMYEWHPGKLPTHMEPEQWRTVLEMFLQGFLSADIASKTGLNIKQILKAVGYARSAMTTDVPMAFSELAPNINMLHSDLLNPDQLPFFGILYYKNHIWIRRIDDSRPLSDLVTGIRFAAYAGKDNFEITTYDEMERLELESFWLAQKSLLTGRSGHRSEKFGLYLAEAVWRHNHKKQSCTSQIEHLLYIIGQAWYLRNKK